MRRFSLIASALLAFLLLLSTNSYAKNIIFDTDMRFDDWQSLLYLSHHRETKLEGVIITIYDKDKCVRYAKMARYLLSLDKEKNNVPILCLAEAPISGYHDFPHQFDEFSFKAFRNILKNDQSTQDLDSIPLNDFYTDFSEWEKRISKEELYYLLTGPATNLAILKERHYDFFKRIEDVVATGGAIHVPGNLITPSTREYTNKKAEWNVWVDIAAYEHVLRYRPMHFYLLPLDVLEPLLLEYSDKKLFSTKTASEHFIRKMYDEINWDSEDQPFYYWSQLASVIILHDRQIISDQEICLHWEDGSATTNRLDILSDIPENHIFDQKRPLETVFSHYGHLSGAIEFEAFWRQSTCTICFKSNKKILMEHFLKPFRELSK